MNIFSPDYERLSKLMENEFLALGNRSYGILKKSQAISEKTVKLSSRIDEFELGKAENCLKQLQQRIESMSDESKRRFVKLSDILDSFKEVEKNIIALGQNVGLLNHVCSATNDQKIHNSEEEDVLIEGAHDLKDRGTAIDKKFSLYSRRVSEIGEMIRKNMEAALQKEQHRAHQSNVILRQIFSSLEPLRDKHRISADILHHFSIRYQAIFKNIADIVECLQFHDITRQRIERSRAAITGIEAQLINPGRITASGHIENVVAIGQIQAIQLCQAKAGLEYASRTIGNNLKSLSFDIHEIITAAKNLGELTGRHGESFLDNIERNISSLQIATKDFFNKKEESVDPPGDVSRYLNELSALIKEIEEAESLIMLFIMDVNCDEKNSGASEASSNNLEADASNFAEEIKRGMDGIAKDMHSIESAICALYQVKAEDFGDPLYEMSALDSEFEAMIQQLQLGNHYAEGALAELEVLSASLLEDVLESSRFFKHPEALLQEIEKACLQLESQIIRAKSHIPPKQCWERRQNRYKPASPDAMNEEDLEFAFDIELTDNSLNEPRRDRAKEIPENEKEQKTVLRDFHGRIELF